jgi:hypothetical protein
MRREIVLARTPRLYLAPLLLLFCADAALADQGIVYALISDGDAATVSAPYSLNPGVGAVTAARTGIGTYTVTFPSATVGPSGGLSTGWTVQASAYGSNTNYCKMQSWGGAQAFVACYNAAGSPANSPFTVLGVSIANDKDIYFALANQPTTASYSPDPNYVYNPGGAVTIRRENVGVYLVSFQGQSLSTQTINGTVQVNAFGSDNVFCFASAVNATNEPILVSCANPAGNPVDSLFVIDIVSATVAPTGIAYTWANQPTNPSYAPDSRSAYNSTGGAVNVSRSSAGQYLVKFAGLGVGQVTGGNVLVSSVDGSRCSVQSWTPAADSSLQISVGCSNFVGSPVDDEFVVLALPPSGVAYAAVSTAPSIDSAHSLNPGGGVISVTENSIGQYTVSFPNSGIGLGWSVQVNAQYDGAQGDYCNLTDWSAGTVSFSCFSRSGPFSDETAGSILAISNTNGKNMAFATVGRTPVVGSYALDSTHSYNPAGPITFTRISTGLYQVVFKGLDGSEGTAQVTAYDPSNSGVMCNSGGWKNPDFTAYIECVTPGAGTPADSGFTISVIPAGATPSGIAFAVADQASTTESYTPEAAYLYNPGGSASVLRKSMGVYEVTFDGLDPSSLAGGKVLVTEYLAPNDCSAGAASSMNGAEMVEVDCFNSLSAPADEVFIIQVIAPVVGPPSTFEFTGGGGSGQSAKVNTPFASPITISVIDGNGNPVPGVPFTFAAPSSGPSATFAGSSLTATVITNAQGVAVSPTFTANGTLGLFHLNLSAFGLGAINFGETNIVGDPAAITVAGGSPQSATVNTAFATALSVLVSDSGNNPVPATMVTFTAPGSGASGAFPGAALAATVATNASGIATAPAFIANSSVGIYNVTASAGAATPAKLSLTNTSGSAAAIAVSAGSGQTAATNAPFGIALQAVVTDALHNPVSGVTVTFTAPNAGASGIFQGPSLNATGITNASGIASAPPFTANGIAGGPYIVSATAGGVPTAANFSLTNAATTAPITIQTSPEGLSFTLDMTVYSAPQTLSLAPGTHTLSVATTQAGAPGTQYLFNSWGDSGAASRSITVGNSAAAYTASFTTQYQLTISASPAGAGTATPVSGGFYNSGSVTPITATANSGYAFTGWSGNAASASSASTTVTMSAAQTVVANFSPLMGPTAFFTDQVPLGSGVYYLQFPDGNLFGYYNFPSGSILYHYDMGFEAFVPGSAADVYLYDFTSNHWWYTSNTLFPYLYDFTLGTWIYYFPSTPNPGRYTTGPRYFSNLTTGMIFTM